MASWPWTDSWYSSSTMRIAAALLIAGNAAVHYTAHGAENRAASGDSYPSKPVRFISPFSAGGGTDVVARVLAQRISEAIGRPFVVDNRGGAEGAIGTDLGAKSPPDGYTLLVANLGTICLTPNLRTVPTIHGRILPPSRKRLHLRQCSSCIQALRCARLKSSSPSPRPSRGSSITVPAPMVRRCRWKC